MFGLSAIRTPRYKLIEARRDAGGQELYDLRDDPRELRDLADGAGPQRGVADRMSTALQRWRRAAADTRMASRLTLDVGQRERLRALGYLE